MKRVTVDNFRSDPLFRPVQRAVAEILTSATTVAPVEVTCRIGWLHPNDFEAWRHGRVPFLERVLDCNLSRLSRFLRVMGFHCHDLNLTARQASYPRPGGGPPLRFTKTGEPKLEKIYARHFVWPGKGPFPLDRRWGPGGPPSAP